MKRPIILNEDLATKADRKMKKIKPQEEEGEEEVLAKGSESVLLDENLLYEVLKHADARTLATAACVSRQWHRTAQDERLWELVCTTHWANIGCGNQQLRSVVLPLGGFRRLHSLYLRPLSKPSSASSSASASAVSMWPCLPPPLSPAVPAKSATANKSRWGKDEINLSLSLLSIRYYEKLNFNNRGK